MPWNTNSLTAQAADLTAQPGQLVQLVGLHHKHFIFRLQEGGAFQSHRGVLKHDDMIGQPWGTQIFSHNGAPFFMIQPALGDLLRGLKRNTQILYPKDIGYVLVSMGIGPGMHILEAGTGSGALTCAFAYMVGPQGHVTTYEARPEMQAMAQRNAAHLQLDDRITFQLGNVGDGFAESGVDALFLDLPNPHDYIPQVRAALKPGGFFGCIVPTTNQVSMLLTALRREQFAFLDVCELILRFYKPEPNRLRPTDRMIAHTGFLVFGRPVTVDLNRDSRALMRETGLFSETETFDDEAAAAASIGMDDPDAPELFGDQAGEVEGDTPSLA